MIDTKNSNCCQVADNLLMELGACHACISMEAEKSILGDGTGTEVMIQAQCLCNVLRPRQQIIMKIREFPSIASYHSDLIQHDWLFLQSIDVYRTP